MNSISRSKTAMKSTSFKYEPVEKRVLRQLDNAVALQKVGEIGLANRLAKCSMAYQKWDAHERNKNHCPDYRCGSRYCEFCYWKHSKSSRRRYRLRLEHLFKLGYRFSFLTLTIPNVPEIDRAECEYLFKCLNLLLAQKVIRCNFLGCLAKIETEFNRETRKYNTHLHCIIVWRKCVPQPDICNLWGDIIEPRFNSPDIPRNCFPTPSVMITKIYDNQLVKKLKYICKINRTYDADAFAQYVIATTGTPLLRSYGILRGRQFKRVEKPEDIILI